MEDILTTTNNQTDTNEEENYLGKRTAPENFLQQSDEEDVHQEETQIIKPEDFCVSCYKQAGKYRCTGCHLKLCSPLCIKQHKEVPIENYDSSSLREHLLSQQPVPCSNKNIPTAFVPRNSLNKRVILRDFSFISGVMESTSHVKKKLSLLSNNM